MQQALVPGADFKNTEIVTRLGASKLKKVVQKEKKTLQHTDFGTHK